MSIDSQRLEIEQVRRKVSDWQIRQPDFERLLSFTARHWLRPALDTLDMSDMALVRALAHAPGADALRNLLSEQAFGLKCNDESLFDRFVQGPGHGESGLRYRYLRRLADSVPSLWRVVGVEPGVRVDIAPWDGGGGLTVRERTHSRDVRPNEALVTRLIDMPAGPVFGDGLIHVRSVAPGALHDSSDGVRRLLSHCVTELLGATPARATPERGTRAGERADGRVGERDERRAAGADAGRPRVDLPPAGADRDRLLERVRKLFAMAQQAEASPHEAEIALRRCESLMAKYGISEADLETSAFGNAEFSSGRTVPMHVKYLAAAVAKLHDVLFVTGRGGFAEFRGFEVDANVARLTLDYLIDAVERALTARKRAGAFPAGRSAAYDYRIGFASEVDRRVAELVAERARAQRQAAGTGTALAVRKREIVERECGRDLSQSSFRGRGPRDAAARAAGHDDGARVSLDRQVEGAPDLPALPGR